ncbi:MAG: amino acid ABC transporter substrate-binding protein [Betaproteobacteria bacterium]|nr:amino acid ABC transporter substrate-binding protein [Betaproteobacteria bacterium]
MKLENIKRPISTLSALAAVLLAANAWSAPPPSVLPPEAPNLSAPPAALVPPPSYKPQASTLEKIRNYGAIYLGHRDASIPFSYMDDDGKVHGYSWELCLRIADAVKARLNLPELPVVPVPASSSTRIMMVETATIDLYCGSSTNTDQRARYVSFSNTYFVTGIKGLVRKNSGIKSIADLQGKTIITTAGTTSDTYVKAAATRRNVFVNYRSARSHRDAFNDVLNGKADVFVLDDILLHGLLAETPQAEAYKLVLVDESFGYEPYGLMFRRGDPDFKKLVDETLVGLMKSGEIERIYAKWFLSAVPPKGINLNVPLSPELKQLFQTPNDRGI